MSPLSLGLSPLLYLGAAWIAYHLAVALHDVRSIIRGRRDRLIRIGHQPTGKEA